jgi:hypothetical protein
LGWAWETDMQHKTITENKKDLICNNLNITSTKNVIDNKNRVILTNKRMRKNQKKGYILSLCKITEILKYTLSIYYKNQSKMVQIV